MFIKDNTFLSELGLNEFFVSVTLQFDSGSAL